MSVPKSFTGLLFLLSITVAGSAQKQARLAAFFKRIEKTRQFSGNVLVAENGKVIFKGAYGYADFDTRQPNRINTSFPIASISKTMAATAILQLAEQGKLTVNDPVSRHLAGFPYPDVTIRHLLSHTSGLPPYNAFFKPAFEKDSTRVFTNADFLPAAIAVKPALIYTPGSNGNYDNVNYLVLALIIEKISGKAFPDYIQQHILDPAGMKHTRFIPLSTQFNTDTLRNYAFPYLYRGMFDVSPIKTKSIPYVRDYWRTYAVTGFGEYVSTVEDLLLYDQALYTNRLLRAETLQQSVEPVRLNDGKLHPQLFGLGWEVEADSTHGKAVYHSGAATGLSSVMIHNIDKNLTVILFDNCHYNAHETGDQVMKLLNGDRVEKPKYSIARAYGITLQNQGAVAAKKQLQKLMKDTLNYRLSESEINQLGYDFLGTDNPYRLPERHLYAQALETFKLNTELFPNSWNAYDSYGEALLMAGQLDQAEAMYRRSVELNPNSTGGKKALEKILEKKNVKSK